MFLPVFTLLLVSDEGFVKKNRCDNTFFLKTEIYLSLDFHSVNSNQILIRNNLVRAGVLRSAYARHR